MPLTSRGDGSEFVLKRVLDYVHETLKVESIFLKSPWYDVSALCERAGLPAVAIIDRYYVQGQSKVLRIMRREASWATTS